MHLFISNHDVATPDRSFVMTFTACRLLVTTDEATADLNDVACLNCLATIEDVIESLDAGIAVEDIPDFPTPEGTQ